MTDPTMALRTLLEKSSDTDLLREMIGFTARRLVAAHERAAQTALALAQQHFAATRIREDGTVRRETTGNPVIASFRHGTSRALDPQLHSHNIILNMTQDEAGQWRSLEPRAFYQMQKQVGAIYRQELADEV
jgi:conjugative relaxase-like TrwC/TraI family protein